MFRPSSRHYPYDTTVTRNFLSDCLGGSADRDTVRARRRVPVACDCHHVLGRIAVCMVSAKRSEVTAVLCTSSSPFRKREPDGLRMRRDP